MTPVNGKIIVSCDLKQKNSICISGTEMQSAILFETNYREKSPVIATVIEGNEMVKEGDVLITHHNNFYLPSPYHLYDNTFSIPFSKTLFAKIDKNGKVIPICGNMICENIEIESDLFIPSEKKRFHTDRYKVIDEGWTNYKKGSIIFTRPYSGYEIVYNVNSIEKRIIKVDSEMICGVC
jgi:hypothetical protein